MPNRPLLLGHRGARAHRSVPENTMASFDLALEHGCDGFEFDVRLTADGRAVICHDPTVAGIDVAGATQSELATLPQLDQVLEKFAARAFLDIEVKVAGLEKHVLAALRRYPPKRGFVVSSFLPPVLLAIHAVDGSVPLGFLCDAPAHLAHWRELPVEYVIPHFSLVQAKLVDDVHAAGKKFFTWTVNQRKAMQRFAGWGADAIISDDTQLLVRTLSRTAP